MSGSPIGRPGPADYALELAVRSVAQGRNVIVWRSDDPLVTVPVHSLAIVLLLPGPLQRVDPLSLLRIYADHHGFHDLEFYEAPWSDRINSIRWHAWRKGLRWGDFQLVRQRAEPLEIGFSRMAMVRSALETLQALVNGHTQNHRKYV